MPVAGDVNTVATVYGAILLGTCFGCGLTGIVFVQCVLYYKLYPDDFAWTKALVFAVWSFDMMHTICIVIAVWESVITKFNRPDLMDEIPSALGLSVAVTALVTFMVHCFFANRIRMLTRKWQYAAPVVFLAFLRLFAAFVSTSEIIRLKRFSLFIKPYPAWVFTLGVTLSASVEFIITTVMVIFLGSRKTGFATMNHLINTLILYTLETGSFTCLVTIASLICWLAMRHNLIFLGMHFAIAKLYANSLLATLNMRKRLRVDYVGSCERELNHQLTPIHSSINKRHLPRAHDHDHDPLQTRTRMLAPIVPQKKSIQLNVNVNVETVTVSHVDENKDRDGTDIEESPADEHTPTTFEQDEGNDVVDPGRFDREDKKYPLLV